LERDAFCSSEIRGQVFLEDRHFMVAYDIRPLLPGHVLLIPKRHVLQITDLTKEELVSFSSTLRKVIPKLLSTYGGDGYNLAVNYGEDAGQSIMHLHFHLIPRNSRDGFQGSFSKFYWMLLHKRNVKVREAECRTETKRLRKLFRYRQRPAR
jgi:diadenosine tetraphosphate (Ap4A) HIT family hydrolase